MRGCLQNRLSCYNRSKSFTLLEVMLVLSIVSISLLTMIKAFSLIAQADSTIKDYTKAMFLIKEKLCDLEIKGFDNYKKERRFSEPFDKFCWSLRSSDLSADIAKVDLSVSWGTARSKRKLKIATCLRKKSP